MKKLFIGTLALLALVSCAPKQQCNAVHTKWAYDATIYELNTRQATEEGTFAAAEALLPEIKESAQLIEVVEGEEVERMDGLLSLAQTGGDFNWI